MELRAARISVELKAAVRAVDVLKLMDRRILEFKIFRKSKIWFKSYIQDIYYVIYQGAGKRPGQWKKEEEKKPNREKSERSCQCLYTFLTTQSKKPNLRRRLNHVFINQIVWNFFCSFIYDILEGCKNFKEIQWKIFKLWIVKISCF